VVEEREVHAAPDKVQRVVINKINLSAAERYTRWTISIIFSLQRIWDRECVLL